MSEGSTARLFWSSLVLFCHVVDYTAPCRAHKTLQTFSQQLQKLGSQLLSVPLCGELLDLIHEDRIKANQNYFSEHFQASLHPFPIPN